jgi:hypothetical protein
MPPSSDDLPGKKRPRKQRRAAERGEKKRKRGKQPGSPGASMTWEVPDRTEDHYPEGSCPCGLDLADAEDLGVARSYQQEEIPVAPAERVQHDLHSGKCACGRVHDITALDPCCPRSSTLRASRSHPEHDHELMIMMPSETPDGRPHGM